VLFPAENCCFVNHYLRYTSFNRGFSSSGKGDDDFPFDSSLLQESQGMQGGAAKRLCTDPPAEASTYPAVQEPIKLNSPANLLPLGMVAPPLRVSSPLVLRCAIPPFLDVVSMRCLVSIYISRLLGI
jgi:hypothetical protein